MPELPQQPARCPRCGNRNQCAMAAGARDAASCWCSRTTVQRAALIDVPGGSTACLCARCAQGGGQQQ